MARLFDDGSSEYLTSSLAPVASVPLTLACWAYTDDVTAALDIIMVCDPSDGDGEGFYLELRGDLAGDYLRAYTVGAGSYYSAITTSSVTVNTWHHYCGVFSASNSRSVFLDGGGKGTDSNSLVPANVHDTFISGWAYSDTVIQHWSGSVAEVAMWNIALTDAEVLVLAAGFSPLFVKPQNLVFYVPLVRDDDNDVVGGISMTPINTPSVSAHPRIIRPVSPIFARGVVAAGIQHSLAGVVNASGSVTGTAYSLKILKGTV